MAEERIQKILARAGIASRRKAEEMILEGQITINGRQAKLGDKAEFGKDAIKVNGKLLRTQESMVYFLFNKPRNVLSTLSDPGGRPTIGDYLKRIDERVYPVGRLDFSSEGAILLTNDGNLAEKLQKSPKLLRVYHVKVAGHPKEADLLRLRKGGRVEGRLLVPHSVRLVENFTQKGLIEVVIEGSSGAELKTYFEHKSLLVNRMVRVGLGHLRISGMKPGEMRLLEKGQVEALVLQPELAVRLLEHEAKKSKARTREDEPDYKKSGKKPKLVLTVPKKKTEAPKRDREDRGENRREGRREERKEAIQKKRTTVGARARFVVRRKGESKR